MKNRILLSLTLGLLFLTGCASLKETAREAGRAAVEGAIPALKEAGKEAAERAATIATDIATNKLRNQIANDKDLSDEDRSKLLAMLSAGGSSLLTALGSYLVNKGKGKALRVITRSVDALPPEVAAIVKAKVKEMGGDSVKATITAAKK